MKENTNVFVVGISMLVAGLVVGFLVGWFSHKSGYTSVSDENLDSNSTSTNMISSSSAPVPGTVYKSVAAVDSVSIVDQRAGSLVFVQHVGVSAPTWVAVREIIDGAVGNILGAEMVTSPTDDVPVTLLRPTKTGQQYGVFLYQDDGNGEFDFKNDPLVMQGDAPISALFVAQ